MELIDLVGEHMLDAVDFDTEQLRQWHEQFELCDVIRFRLDGRVYTAIEDPEDGYRSCMREIHVGDHPMKNTFEPVRVTCRHITESERGDVSDILELIDAKTGLCVVEVGTCRLDDYYPCFVANFSPEAMCINRKTDA